MPANRNALVRYKTIDQCLQNRYRQWTLEDLIDACSDALYEYEGIDKGVSRRTVQADIQMMRSDKLGYNAPILVREKKFYAYEEEDYSITNIPLTDQDLGKLSEAVEFMKQFNGFSHFRQLDAMVQKLEDHIYSQKTQTTPAIDFEKNENLKGLEYLDRLYQSIVQKKAVLLQYKSFKAHKTSSFDFHPYLLKEFRNRWFLLGRKKASAPILTLALDRIEDVQPSEKSYKAPKNFDASQHFDQVIGVTVSEGLDPIEAKLAFSRHHAPYVITKPLHHSQEVLEKSNDGIVVSLLVQHNFEFERDILSFGEGVKVLKPKRLRKRIESRLRDGLAQY